jgi:hypothetical protein
MSYCESRLRLTAMKHIYQTILGNVCLRTVSSSSICPHLRLDIPYVSAYELWAFKWLNCSCSVSCIRHDQLCWACIDRDLVLIVNACIHTYVHTYVNSNCQTVTNILSWASDVVRHLDSHEVTLAWVVGSKYGNDICMRQDQLNLP